MRTVAREGGIVATTEHFDRAAAIFEAALDLQPDTRAVFIAQACGNDGALRAEVESLLEHDKRADAGFLRSPVVEMRAQQPSTPAWARALTGRKIGRYTIQRLLGHGGMGCVFEARQEQPARTVALKVLAPGFSAPSALARFRLEPELLGRLQHPNIAQVFEAGIHEDETGTVPYFAMEYVADALPLLAYADSCELTTRQRLTLFAKVCDAIHHGHQKGVIHRDIKPANILVGADGEPRVIDLGVARASDSDIMLTTQCTHIGDLVGTVHYMSPEQCDGNPEAIDTRSDIYSLGVVLYELVTGATPYDTSGTTLYEVIRLIKEQLPRAPRALCRHVSRDVEAIALKALEKAPACRYESAADLAQDIRRHLGGMPIEARRPGRCRRLLYWAGRHPRLTAILTASLFFGLVAVTTLAGSRLYIWYYFGQPARVEYGPERHSVALMSRSGTPLHVWHAKSLHGMLGEPIRLHHDDDRPRYVVLGYLTDDREHAGQLQMFDLHASVHEPRWSWQIHTKDLPEAALHRGCRADQFAPTHIWVFDVFPETHGPAVNEIVCQFGHNINSWRALCIFDKDGELLYSIWNDGQLFDCHWLPEPRLLIVTGENQTRTPHERGCLHAGPGNYLLVVFALQPARHMLAPRTVVDQITSHSAELAWYKWLSVCPLPTTPWVLRPKPLRDGDVHAIVELGLNFETAPPCAISWRIDRHGNRVAPHVAASYRAVCDNPDNADLSLPPVEAFELQDTPPGE